MFVALDTENVSQVSLFRQKKEACFHTWKQKSPCIESTPLHTTHKQKKNINNGNR